MEEEKKMNPNDFHHMKTTKFKSFKHGKNLIEKENEIKWNKMK